MCFLQQGSEIRSGAAERLSRNYVIWKGIRSLDHLGCVFKCRKIRTNEPLFHESAVYCTLTNQSQRLTYQGSVLPTLQATARLLSTLSVPPGALSTLATADHTYSTRDFMPHVLLSHLNISFYLYLLHIYINIKVSALDWQSLPERLCSRTPASTVLYRTGHSVMNYSFAVVLCVSESVKDIFRLHACLQDSSLFPHFLITTWPSTTADYGYPS
ncbi:hypothetical protein J6590_072161 [Homalodisca vitripennis]|nr:hypothetical protein J6590_072161 [Homalodisca vitripennis]